MGSQQVTAWRPPVAGLAEVFHAHFVEHVYPMHTHAAWTLLIIDEGAVRFALDRHEHGALTSLVTVLPPQVPHNGRSATPHGFRKRVLYLDETVLPTALIGHAVDQPGFTDPLLRQRIHQLHSTLAQPAADLEAQSRLALVADRLVHHLRRREPVAARRDPTIARRLRDLLDANVPNGLSLTLAAGALGAHPAHLVRAFTAEFGLPPHQYLIGRRVDTARRLLLAGARPAEAATEAGFYDQAHLGRHFKRVVGTSPGRFRGPGLGHRP